MKIAQVAPLYESVPPRCYGGTERVVSYLTEELVRKGHEITLFASGDSVTSAKLVPCCPRSLRRDDDCVDPLVYHFLQLEEVYSDAESFDIIHFHNDYLHFPVSKRLMMPNVTTLHGRLDLRDLGLLYKRFHQMPLVSISNSQRQPLAFANWQATVYHGLPDDLFDLRQSSGDHLAFLGRISPEKGVDRAIEIAKRVQMPLKIAAKIDKTDREYFERVIKPLLNDPLIEFVGEIDQDEKRDFLGSAYALLFPVDWPEPFGLVMIEAMACGTPIIAYRKGSVPEVMKDTLTGFIVDDVESAVEAVEHVANLDRRKCREVFEHQFSAARMAEDYLAVYSKILASRRELPAARAMQRGKSASQASL